MSPQDVLNRIAWAFAPDWALWLSQDQDGECGFWDCEPVEYGGGQWTFPGNDEPRACYTHPNSLGYYGKQRRPA
jgi:hypothetical protein